MPADWLPLSGLQSAVASVEWGPWVGQLSHLGEVGVVCDLIDMGKGKTCLALRAQIPNR